MGQLADRSAASRARRYPVNARGFLFKASGTAQSAPQRCGVRGAAAHLPRRTDVAHTALVAQASDPPRLSPPVRDACQRGWKGRGRKRCGGLGAQVLGGCKHGWFDTMGRVPGSLVPRRSEWHRVSLFTAGFA
eukprot:15446433-Alexandrium_andersonii.AAC.2